MAAKPLIATTSLAGCFGCHMSLLDIDERILDLVELVEFHKSPIDDLKEFSARCAVGPRIVSGSRRPDHRETPMGSVGTEARVGRAWLVVGVVSPLPADPL